MCIFCILNGKGAPMISIQSFAHVFDEIPERQRLADILFCSCKLYFLTPAVVLQHFHINMLYANMWRFRQHRSSCVDIGLSATLWLSLKSFITVTPAVNSLSGKLPRLSCSVCRCDHECIFNLINWPFLLTRNLCSNNLLEIDAECRKWDIHQGACVPPAAPRLIWKYFRLLRPCCLRSQDYIYPRSIACLTGAHGGLW